jgi:hypothetical protein
MIGFIFSICGNGLGYGRAHTSKRLTIPRSKSKYKRKRLMYNTLVRSSIASVMGCEVFILVQISSVSKSEDEPLNYQSQQSNYSAKSHLSVPVKNYDKSQTIKIPEKHTPERNHQIDEFTNRRVHFFLFLQKNQ